ncbi:PP2C family protein-serine/threonine phosphatase [Streptomyces sp. NBC_01190]|uniref:PP2C family protein-serine/threonine phosphatase n=1 Tax=Streptomyces sp. NBC_01190 TaxID=2903767 RepID=UPI003867E5FE|nr:serine/threonine-protein phosphatase [Streptomyces sp. NBC_01190]
MRRLWTRIKEMDESAGAGGRWLLPLSLLVTIAVPVADAFLPPMIHLAHVLVVPVALVAAFKGPRWGVGAAVAAVISILVAAGERHTLTTESVLVELASLVSLSALLVLFSHLRERRQRELERLRRVSAAAQGVVLRPLPQQAGPLSIASEYRAAEDGTRLGGDLYAVARTDDATRLLIGDVRGRGLSSIGDTESVLGAFRAAAYRKGPLPELVGSLEEGFRWSLAELTEPVPGADPGADSGADAAERFVTAAIVEIPDDEPCVRVISCGHPGPLLLRDGAATVLEVAEPAPPLGLGGLGQGTTYFTSTFDFGPGDRLILYTDGVSEARNRHGVFYPLVERAAQWAGDHPPQTLLRVMTDDLFAYADGVFDDDMAVVALQRTDWEAAIR